MKKTALLTFAICVGFTLFSQEINRRYDIHHTLVENKGQWPENVLFFSDQLGGNLWIEKGAIMYDIRDYSKLHEEHVTAKPSSRPAPRKSLIKISFLNADFSNTVVKKDSSYNYFNYFIGNHSKKWASGCRGYHEVIFPAIYPQIDLHFFQEVNETKYEYHIHPGGKISDIRLKAQGQEKIKLTKEGDLIFQTPQGNVIEEKPYAYQIKNGRIEKIECHFVLQKNHLSFEIGAYDKNLTLIIDPILVFATYDGSITDNFGMTATYASDGKAFSGGTIYGNAYPTPDPNAWNTTSNLTMTNLPAPVTTDVFISKYSEDGTTMLWTTFIGGGDDTHGTETVHSLIADPNDNLYLFGATSSADFPIINGYQSIHGGGTPLHVQYNGVQFDSQGCDIYVAKFSADGHQLLGSTFMGGAQNDGTNYKITSGTYNSFAAYDSLTTNYGDQFRGEIMLDQNGDCIVASCSRSNDFPVLNAFQPNNAGIQDGVIFKLSGDLSTLLWSSYFGGSNNDACYSVKVDSSYNIVFSGGTTSTDLPNTAGAYQTTYQGGTADGFVAKIDAATNTLFRTSYIGTSTYDQAHFVEIDRYDNIYLLGQSVGGNFPVSPGVYSNPNSGQFICQMPPDLTSITRSTVFGNGTGGLNISPSAFMVDVCGNLYVSGWGANLLQGVPLSGMPVTADAFQATPPNGFDFYLFVLERQMQSLLYATYLGGNSAQEHVDGGTSRFDRKRGVVYQSVCCGCGGFSDFPTTPGAWSNQNLSPNCNNLIFKFDFEIVPDAEFTVNQIEGCAPFEVHFDNFSSDSTHFLWDFGNGDTSSIIFNPIVVYDTPGTYIAKLYAMDTVCLLIDSAEITITVHDSLVLKAPNDTVVCSTPNLNLIANSYGTATTFLWSSNPNFTDTLNNFPTDSIIDVTPSQNSDYYIKITNPWCTKIDTIQVFFVSESLHFSYHETICKDEKLVITATNSNPSVTFTFDWGEDSILIAGDFTAQATFLPQDSTEIFVHAVASNGCIIDDTFHVNVNYIDPNSITVNANPDSIPEGGSTQLSANFDGSYNYTWSPSNLVNSPNALNTTATLDKTTQFDFIVTDGVCTLNIPVLVKVYSYICGAPYLFIPNAFTPDASGHNDVLYIRGPYIKEMIFRIYNRWGQLVFESYDQSKGWNGTYKGKLLDPDVYDYYLDVTCLDGQTNIIKGNITLIR